MAVYNQLLLEAGGGIINRGQQSDRTDDATVAIGLGGTGTDALIRLKSEVYKRLKADDEDAAVPKYRHLRFLAIDSDAAKINAQKNLNQLQKASEYFDISVPDIKRAFNSKDMLNSNKALEWLNHENISIKDAANGAGGIRQVGRYLLISKATELKAKLKSIILEATRGCTGDLYVHVFSGISGGTGSGTFLDVCYILRHILEELGRHNATICGYFFLPDVNLSVPEVAADPLVSPYIGKNGYAALKELDYLMNLERSKDKFSQNYGSFSYETCQPPVDLCHLISTTNTEGVLMAGGYNYAMSVVSDYVLAYMSKTQLPAGVTKDNDSQGITLKGHVANLEQAKNQIQIMHGATYDYNILGAANAEMPFTQISTYLASKLFEKFSGMYTQLPTENDLNNFIKNSQLTYENILSELCKGVNFKIRIPNMDLKTLKQGASSGTGAPALVKACDNWNADANGKFQENMRALTEPMDGKYQFSENPKSLTAKVYNQLFVKYVTAPEYGPFFAKHLLYSTTQKSLTNVIDGYVKKNAELKAAEVRQDDLRRQELQDAVGRIRNSGFLNEKSRGQEYLQAMERWYIHLTRVEMYTFMETLLMDFKKGIAELDQNFFHVLTTVLDALKETFAKNCQILTEGTYGEQGTSYTWYILSVPEVKDDLDEEIKKIDMKTVMQSFLSMMMEQYQRWMQLNEADIAKIVSDFMNHQFETLTNRTILYYLQQKYGTTNESVLTDTIRSEIFEGQMEPAAKPLFWHNTLVDLASLATNSTLSVPFNSQEIVNAAHDFAASKGHFGVRETGLTDRMFMMSFYSGVPLYAYQGLVELETQYEAKKTPGIHLHEKDVDWGVYLPSPIPVSFKPAGYDNKRIKEMNEQYLSEYAEAKANGIIIENKETKQQFLRTSPAIDLEEIRQKYSDYKENGSVNIPRAEECKEEVAQIIAHLYDNGETIEIVNNGVSDYRGQTFEDYYCKYSRINHLVREELEKKKPLVAFLAEIDADVEKANAEGEVRKAFFQAIFTGTTKMRRGKVTYTYQKYGADECVTLLDGDMPLADFEVYQAYLTYQELEPSILEKINEDASKKVKNMTDEIYEEALALKDKHDADLMGDIKQWAGKRTRAEKEAILNFYDAFLDELTKYIRRNR